MKRSVLFSIITGAVIFVAAVTCLFSCRRNDDENHNNNNQPNNAAYIGTWRTTMTDSIYYYDNRCDSGLAYRKLFVYPVRWTWTVWKGTTDNDINISVTEDFQGDEKNLDASCGPCFPGQYFDFPVRGKVFGTHVDLEFTAGGNDRLSGQIEILSGTVVGNIYDSVTCPASGQQYTSVWTTNNGDKIHKGINLKKVN
jgi:hypothetical protein